MYQEQEHNSRSKNSTLNNEEHHKIETLTGDPKQVQIMNRTSL